MTMTLYYSEASPYARRVRAVAIEKQLALTLVPVITTDNDPDFLAVNPTGKIPALVTDEGVHYTESGVISAYLDHVGQGEPLIPQSPEARLAMWRREALAQGVMDHAVRLTMEGKRPEATQWQEWKTRQEAAIMRTLALLESEADIISERLTLFHVTLGCALGYLDLRHEHLNWRDACPGLANWFAVFATRPCMTETVARL